MIVAIDGPAGAGKGTVAKALAGALGWRYVDTGALYRAVALACLRDGIDPSDGEAAARIARSAAIVFDDERVVLDGVDATDEIRAPAVTRAVSTVSAHAEVRRALLVTQRAIVEGGGDVVIEGRDIGTTVAPDADVKIFLTAAPRERARRRALQLGLGEDAATLDRVERDVVARDEADARRAASPFRRAADAIVVDTTDRTAAEVVAIVEGLVKEAVRGAAP